MIIVHHLNNSRSQRIIWLLEELGLPYEVKRYERDPRTLLAPVSLKKVHPLGKSPVITDGNVTIAESAAIIEYLLEKYGGELLPKSGSPEWLRYKYWMHYAEGSAMPPLFLSIVFSKLPSQVPFLIRPVAFGISKAVLSSYVEPQIRNHLDFMEAELNRSEWFAGPSFSAADIIMSFPVEAADVRVSLTEKRPKLRAYLQRIHSRPAYQKALETGGPFEIHGVS